MIRLGVDFAWCDDCAGIIGSEWTKFFGRHQKFFKKDIAFKLNFDILNAPLRPKGRMDSIVCGPITDSHLGTGLMACQLQKVAEKNFSYYAS